MAYTVTGVPLIPQTMGMSCWFASAQMVASWRRGRVLACEEGRPTATEVPALVKLRAADNGLGLGQMLAFASLMGFKTVAPMCPTMEAIEYWLRAHGPLWFAGQKTNNGSKYGHVWVIVGRKKDELWIHDPEPRNKGTRAWVGTGWLNSALAGYAAVIPTNFMHYPNR